jgi:hypothetical protein
MVLELRSHHWLGETDRAHNRGFSPAEFDEPHAAFLAASIPAFLGELLTQKPKLERMFSLIALSKVG